MPEPGDAPFRGEIDDIMMPGFGCTDCGNAFGVLVWLGSTTWPKQPLFVAHGSARESRAAPADPFAYPPP